MIPTHLVSHIIIRLRYWFTCLNFPIVSAAGAAATLSLGEACDPSDDQCAADSSCQNVTWLSYDYVNGDSEIIPGDDYYIDEVEGNICARDNW